MDNAGQASTDRRSWNPLGCDKEPIMKNLKIQFLAYPVIAVLSVLAASAAFAQGEYVADGSAANQSLKTRDQVRAELVQARADGSIKATSNTYDQMKAAKSVAARADVQAQRDNRFERTWYSEDSGSFALADQAPARPAAALYASVQKNAP